MSARLWLWVMNSCHVYTKVQWLWNRLIFVNKYIGAKGDKIFAGLIAEVGRRRGGERCNFEVEQAKLEPTSKWKLIYFKANFVNNNKYFYVCTNADIEHIALQIFPTDLVQCRTSTRFHLACDMVSCGKRTFCYAALLNWKNKVAFLGGVQPTSISPRYFLWRNLEKDRPHLYVRPIFFRVDGLNLECWVHPSRNVPDFGSVVEQP